MSLLVVDLCGTVVLENTTHGFLRRLDAPRGLYGRRVLLCPAGLALGNLLPSLDHRARLVASLRGISRRELERQSALYAKDALSRAGRQEVLARIASAQRVVLASASLDFIVAAFAAELGISRWVSTELQYDSAGVCEGTIRRDATGCKRRLVEELLGHPLYGHRVLTDNAEDVDLRPGAAAYEVLDAALT